MTCILLGLNIINDFTLSAHPSWIYSGVYLGLSIYLLIIKIKKKIVYLDY